MNGSRPGLKSRVMVCSGDIGKFTRRLFLSEACDGKAGCSNSNPYFTTVRSVLEFMTDDASEAEEMREQMLAFDCVAEVVVLNEPGWAQL